MYVPHHEQGVQFCLLHQNKVIIQMGEEYGRMATVVKHMKLLLCEE